jgi:hypothetical protein
LFHNPEPKLTQAAVSGEITGKSEKSSALGFVEFHFLFWLTSTIAMVPWCGCHTGYPFCLGIESKFGCPEFNPQDLPVCVVSLFLSQARG